MDKPNPKMYIDTSRGEVRPYIKDNKSKELSTC